AGATSPGRVVGARRAADGHLAGSDAGNSTAATTGASAAAGAIPARLSAAAAPAVRGAAGSSSAHASLPGPVKRNTAARQRERATAEDAPAAPARAAEAAGSRTARFQPVYAGRARSAAALPAAPREVVRHDAANHRQRAVVEDAPAVGGAAAAGPDDASVRGRRARGGSAARDGDALDPDRRSGSN